MSRSLRHLLIVAALLFAQFGHQHHGLSHALHDIAVAMYGEDGAPPLDHGLSQCVAYQAVGPALIQPAIPFAAEVPAVELLDPPALPRVTRTRIVFDSRAPPSVV